MLTQACCATVLVPLCCPCSLVCEQWLTAVAAGGAQGQRPCGGWAEDSTRTEGDGLDERVGRMGRRQSASSSYDGASTRSSTQRAVARGGGPWGRVLAWIVVVVKPMWPLPPADPNEGQNARYGLWVVTGVVVIVNGRCRRESEGKNAR
jgi:hypothetical protein